LNLRGRETGIDLMRAEVIAVCSIDVRGDDDDDDDDGGDGDDAGDAASRESINEADGTYAEMD
jgi:hypothetical protein